MGLVLDLLRGGRGRSHSFYSRVYNVYHFEKKIKKVQNFLLASLAVVISFLFFLADFTFFDSFEILVNLFRNIFPTISYKTCFVNFLQISHH